jgi:rRNA-processing protein FCF1
MKTIILDTNFLLIPGNLRIDIFSEIYRIMEEPYQLSIIDMALDELNNIIDQQQGRHKMAAKLALQLIKRKKIKIIKTKRLYMKMNSKTGIADDTILNISDDKIIVATQDKGLRQKLAEKGVKTILLRNKQLELR